MASGALWTLAASLALMSGGAGAAEFRSTSDAAVLYDAPSVRSKPLFALGRDYPLEVIVNVEGWLKVRDIGGTVAWIEKKSVGEKRMLTVRSATADVLAQPEASAQVVFKAEQNVLLVRGAVPGARRVRARRRHVHARTGPRVQHRLPVELPRVRQPGLRRGHAGKGRLLDRRVAISAVDPQHARVMLMAEWHGLHKTQASIRSIRRLDIHHARPRK